MRTQLRYERPFGEMNMTSAGGQTEGARQVRVFMDVYGIVYRSHHHHLSHYYLSFHIDVYEEMPPLPVSIFCHYIFASFDFISALLRHWLRY